MKRSILILLLMIGALLSTGFAQFELPENPLDYFVGEWAQKTSSIDPEPENEDWKSIVTINEFIPILDGKGLHRVAYGGDTVLEGYFFHDAGSGKVYGMSVDQNGYVWQTESVLAANGTFLGNQGGAINDKTVGIETDFEFIHKNEFHFTQYFYEDGKETTVVEGIFIRLY